MVNKQKMESQLYKIVEAMWIGDNAGQRHAWRRVSHSLMEIVSKLVYYETDRRYRK